jgi:hypothetical protein
MRRKGEPRGDFCIKGNARRDWAWRFAKPMRPAKDENEYVLTLCQALPFLGAISPFQT